MIQPKVAFSKDFLQAYSALSVKIQKKVRRFTEKFQSDPTQSGLNFEHLDGATDPKVRSVRIDQAYRAIVVHPPKGDVYLCVWVDHHDKAYEWARNRSFAINPLSGTFQIFQRADGVPAIAVEPQTEGAGSAAEPTTLFHAHGDEDLLLAGVPEPLLASVRAVVSEVDLDALSPHIPSDAAEVLYYLAAGYSLIDAIEESSGSERRPELVDTDDFSAALERPESKERFKVVDDVAELEAVLDAPLEQWRIFLHPSQQKLVRMKANGPVRVLGGAGTGKTVVLIHRANHLASTVFDGPTDRILVTTFTRNLALDLRANLRNLCSPENFARLEIANLHSWAVGYMRREGYRFRIATDPQRRQLFEMAHEELGRASHPLSFYMDEWDQVVQAQEVSSRDDYFTARRVGRGTRLTRRQRAEAWQVFARFRELLEEKGLVEWPDVIRETRCYIEKQGAAPGYRALLSDEVQDFSASELRLLRVLAPNSPNSLFLVGDGHQRIYGQPIRLGWCGIDIRGRGRRLKLGYRTTEQIRNRAVAVLRGREIDDLDGGLDSLKGFVCLRHGPEPVISSLGREADEAKLIVDTLRAWTEAIPPESICVVARTRAQLRDRYEQILEAAGIQAVYVEKDPESEREKPGVRLATMHRLKGLEFSRVLLVGVQDGLVPLTLPTEWDDPESTHRHELQERCLLYVAMTRARDELVVVGYGSPSALLHDPAADDAIAAEDAEDA